MKNKAIFVFFIILLVSCGNKTDSRSVLESYIKGTNNCNYNKIYNLLSDSDKKAVSLEEYSQNDSYISSVLGKYTKYEIMDETFSETKQSVTYTVKMDYVDLLELYKKVPYLMKPNISNKEVDKLINKNKKELDLCRKSNNTSFVLVNENGKWAVCANLANVKYIKKLRQDVLDYEKLGSYSEALSIIDKLYDLGAVGDEMSKAYVRIEQKDNYIKNELHIQKVFSESSLKVNVTNGGTYGLRGLDVLITYIKDGVEYKSTQSMKLTDKEFLGHQEKYTFYIDFGASIMSISKVDVAITNIEF